MSSNPQWFEERAKALAEGDTWPRGKRTEQPQAGDTTPNEPENTWPQEHSPHQQ